MAESFWAELPLGLSMTLAKDPVAKGVFDGLSPEERRAFVEGAHDVRPQPDRPNSIKKPEEEPVESIPRVLLLQGVSPPKKSLTEFAARKARNAANFFYQKGCALLIKLAPRPIGNDRPGSLYRKKSSKVTGTRRAADRGSAPRRTPREDSSRSGSSPRA